MIRWSAPNVTTPAVAAGEFQVCPSLRWENFALGLQDYELLRLAAETEERTKALGGALQTDLNVSQLVELVSQGWAHVQVGEPNFIADINPLLWMNDCSIFQETDEID